jgi:arylsulfatase A-like enzyme
LLLITRQAKVYYHCFTTNDTLFWEHEGGRAARLGDWKIAALKNKDWELFNLADDRTETNNLAGRYPEKVTQLNTLWEIWAKRYKLK